jgi:hypothetical protein
MKKKRALEIQNYTIQINATGEEIKSQRRINYAVKETIQK